MLFSPSCTSCRELNSPNNQIYSTFTYDQYVFSENKIIRSVVGGKVDGQILFGARGEKRKKNVIDAK